MRKLRIIEHISLDGVIQHSADDNNFPFPNWTASYRTPEGRDMILNAHGERFDLLLGRDTYDMWTESWPKTPSTPISDRINAAKKYVVTHRPESLQWGPFEGVSANIVEGIKRIKAQDGPDIVLCGSISVARVVLEHDLADELTLTTYPVVLGTGRRLFEDGKPARTLERTNTQMTPTGIVLNAYKFTGDLKPA